MDSLARTLILAAALAAVVVVPTAANAEISKQSVYLSNGFDGDQIRPAYQTLIGPNQVLIVDLTWRNWGGRKAVGHGTWGYHDCRNGCGSGPLVGKTPVRVVLKKPTPCKRDSSKVYYRVRVIEFTERVPEGVKRRQSSRFPCWEDLNAEPSFSVKPLEVHGLDSGVTSTDTGFNHVCAVRSGGAVLCWGANGFGELGDGTTKDRWRPVKVRGLDGGASSISAGDFYSCAVTKAGGAACWGTNDFGQLGDGTTKARTRPVPVKDLQNVTAIAAGASSTCAITGNGAVSCWGDGRKAPAQVPGLESGVVAVSVGDIFNCALTSAGAVKCWGYNEGGLGNSVTNDSATPIVVSGLESGATSVSVGANHACARTEAGAVKCWGWNGDGELGDGTRRHSWTPVEVTGLQSGVAAMDVGSFHGCAVLDAGGVECWGYNISGEIGLSPLHERSTTPVPLEGAPSGITHLSAGHLVNCVVTGSGGVQCWGNNEMGQLGVSAKP